MIAWHNKPDKEGWYWIDYCENEGTNRFVKVWCYPTDPHKFFTNEDGGAPVMDGLYKGAMWYGPFLIPKYLKRSDYIN